MSILKKIGTRPLLADGAMGSLLLMRGFKAGRCLAELNMVEKAVIQAIHREYMEAGSEIIYTHTFQANRFALEKFGKQKFLEEINKNAVANARVTSKTVYVAGNLGPTGMNGQQVQNTSFEKLVDIFSEQITVFVSEGVDILAFETFTNMKELMTAVEAWVQNGKKTPAIFSVTPKSDGTLYDGTDLRTWVSFLTEKKVDSVGVNCCWFPDRMKDLLTHIHAISDLPLTVKLNAGEPKLVSEKWFYPVDSKMFCEQMSLVFEQASLIGGCCGTTPEYIHGIKIRHCR